MYIPDEKCAMCVRSMFVGAPCAVMMMIKLFGKQSGGNANPEPFLQLCLAQDDEATQEIREFSNFHFGLSALISTKHLPTLINTP